MGYWDMESKNIIFIWNKNFAMMVSWTAVQFWKLNLSWLVLGEVDRYHKHGCHDRKLSSRRIQISIAYQCTRSFVCPYSRNRAVAVLEKEEGKQLEKRKAVSCIRISSSFSSFISFADHWTPSPSNSARFSEVSLIGEKIFPCFQLKTVWEHRRTQTT